MTEATADRTSPLYEEGLMRKVDGTKIRQAIFMKGISQNELARRIGCSYATISNLVNGSRSVRASVFMAVCHELDIDPRECW